MGHGHPVALASDQTAESGAALRASQSTRGARGQHCNGKACLSMLPPAREGPGGLAVGASTGPPGADRREGYRTHVSLVLGPGVTSAFLVVTAAGAYCEVLHGRSVVSRRLAE